MTLEERLAAVERTLTDDEHAPADLSAPAALESRLETLESRLDEVENRLADAEGTVAALRGRVGDGPADRETEQVAQRALATAREAKRRLDEESPAPHERRVVVEEPASEEGLAARLRELW